MDFLGHLLTRNNVSNFFYLNWGDIEAIVALQQKTDGEISQMGNLLLLSSGIMICFYVILSTMNLKLRLLSAQSASWANKHCIFTVIRRELNVQGSYNGFFEILVSQR